MPTTVTGATTTTSLSNLVTTALDRYVEFGLRAQPLFRNFATKRPVDPATPGMTVRFFFYTDLAAQTTALTENVIPDATAVSNASYVDVTMNEYGNVVTTSERLETIAFSDAAKAIANIIAFNAADSLDMLAQNALVGAGTNVILAKGGTTLPTALAAGNGVSMAGTGTGVSTVANTDLLNSKAIRWSVAKLRALKVAPVRGPLYGVVLHPEVSVDLREETGSAGWRDVHTYSAPEGIWTGEVGQYEGCFFVENPRCFNAQAGTGTGAAQIRVFNSYIMGDQALAEAVAIEPRVVIGPVTDPLQRFQPIGWKSTIGWGPYRKDALVNIESSASVHSAL